jgi:ribose transport system substrate-binding protein
MKNTRTSKLLILVICLLFSTLSISFVKLKANKTNSNFKFKKIRTFAIVYPVLHPFFESITRGAEEKAKLANCKLIVKGPDIDDFQVKQQMEILNKLIASKVDGIAIGPTDSTLLAPVINKAMDNGIKVICFDTDSPDSKRISYIGTNNIEAGIHMGEVLAKLLNKKGKIICSTGISSQLNLRQRITGVKLAIKKYPEMKILEVESSLGSPITAVKKIETMILKHPDFDALIGMDSLSGPAAITIWKAMGLKKVLLTFDNLPDILDGIKYGQITASISQNQYRWGELIIQYLNAACDGNKIPELIYTKTTEINKSNISSVDTSLVQ